MLARLAKIWGVGSVQSQVGGPQEPLPHQRPPGRRHRTGRNVPAIVMGPNLNSDRKRVEGCAALGTPWERGLLLN